MSLEANRHFPWTERYALFIGFSLAWVTYFSILSTFLWTNFMLTNLESLLIYCLSVLNLPFITYSMRMEKGPVNILFFPSGMMLYISVEGVGGTPEEEVPSLPGSDLLSSPASFTVCGLSTAGLLQHAAANSAQWPQLPPAPPQLPHGKFQGVVPLCDGFPTTLEGGLPASSTGKASQWLVSHLVNHQWALSKKICFFLGCPISARGLVAAPYICYSCMP